jgi:hypothetical protein
MPIKKPKKKRIRYRDNQKITHELELLDSRAVIALMNYLVDPVDDTAHTCMEQLFRDYKPHKDEIHKSLIHAFKYLTKECFEPDPDYPEFPPDPGPPPSKKVVKAAKKHINRIAKKIWKR